MAIQIGPDDHNASDWFLEIAIISVSPETPVLKIDNTGNGWAAFPLQIETSGLWTSVSVITA